MSNTLKTRCPSCLESFDSLEAVTLLDDSTPICSECRAVEELFNLMRELGAHDDALISFEERHEAEGKTDDMRFATAEEVEDFTANGYPATALLDYKGDVLVPAQDGEAA